MKKDSFDDIFKTRLKELRGEMTLQQLADATGINRVTLTNYENGKRSPDARILTTIARFFNVSLDYLVGISDVKNYDASVQKICDKTGLSESTVAQLPKHSEIINLLFEDSDLIKQLENYIGGAIHIEEKPTIEINDSYINEDLAKILDTTIATEIFIQGSSYGDLHTSEFSLDITENIVEQALLSCINQSLSNIRKAFQSKRKIIDEINDYLEEHPNVFDD